VAVARVDRHRRARPRQDRLGVGSAIVVSAMVVLGRPTLVLCHSYATAVANKGRTRHRPWALAVNCANATDLGESSCLRLQGITGDCGVGPVIAANSARSCCSPRPPLAETLIQALRRSRSLAVPGDLHWGSASLEGIVRSRPGLIALVIFPLSIGRSPGAMPAIPLA
jgi:hypothetical protein